MRKIPVTMATQHPDNTSPSLFTNKRFVSTADEIDECFQCFSKLGVHEYMWDWEGKFVDEAVIDRLYQKYTNYFKRTQLGKDVFLTFRIPNIWNDVSHRLPRAFMNIISAEHAARTYGFHTPPIFEVILPMTESAQQLIHLHTKFREIQNAAETIFEMKSRMKQIDVIPLFETFDVMTKSYDILEEYVSYLSITHKTKPEYLRVFIARSDPAMNYGLIPALIGCKSVINQCHQFMKKTGIPVFPWIGAGSLPFRGGLNPDNIKNAIEEYAGTYSLTIQSAFRYDYPLESVKKAINSINKKTPALWKDYSLIPEKDCEKVISLARSFIPYYQQTVEKIAPLINKVARNLPEHRERVQHIGLFGYSRGLNKVKLPRAIKFTGALYSLGIPPEFIGTGRALRDMKKQGVLNTFSHWYKHIKNDLVHAGHYLNKENLEFLCKKNKIWKTIRDDIVLTEKFLGEKLGPTKVHHMIHRNFTSNIFYKLSLNQDISEDILKAAEVRKSLG